MNAETPYRREPGYAERYRDQRFATGTGRATHDREVAALRALLQVAGPLDGPWLDVPCGAGRLTSLLPAVAVRVDRDRAMLSACDGDRPRVCASALALPFAARAFAGVLCMRLLQHLPHAEERISALRELGRVSHGVVLVSFFHAASLQHGRRRLRAWLGRPSSRVAISARRFRRELTAAGLEIVKVHPLRRWWSEQWIVLARGRSW